MPLLLERTVTFRCNQGTVDEQAWTLVLMPRRFDGLFTSCLMFPMALWLAARFTVASAGPNPKVAALSEVVFPLLASVFGFVFLGRTQPLDWLRGHFVAFQEEETAVLSKRSYQSIRRWQSGLVLSALPLVLVALWTWAGATYARNETGAAIKLAERELSPNQSWLVLPGLGELDWPKSCAQQQRDAKADPCSETNDRRIESECHISFFAMRDYKLRCRSQCVVERGPLAHSTNELVGDGPCQSRPQLIVTEVQDILALAAKTIEPGELKQVTYRGEVSWGHYVARSPANFPGFADAELLKAIRGEVLGVEHQVLTASLPPFVSHPLPYPWDARAFSIHIGESAESWWGTLHCWTNGERSQTVDLADTGGGLLLAKLSVNGRTFSEWQSEHPSHGIPIAQCSSREAAELQLVFQRAFEPGVDWTIELSPAVSAVELWREDQRIGRLDLHGRASGPRLLRPYLYALGRLGVQTVHHDSWSYSPFADPWNRSWIWLATPPGEVGKETVLVGARPLNLEHDRHQVGSQDCCLPTDDCYTVLEKKGVRALSSKKRDECQSAASVWLKKGCNPGSVTWCK